MKITILDSAMCCSTGVCGPDVDDSLVYTAVDVKWLKSLSLEVARHNISNDGIAFQQYPEALVKLEMGVTKSDLFSETQNDLALAAKAFSHPARIAIIQYLLNSNICINSDLVQELGLVQATISQHLRELKDIEIIQGTIEGTRVSYRINHRRWQETRGQFDKLLNQFNFPAPKECC